MAVIINELEVLVEAPGVGAPGTPNPMAEPGPAMQVPAPQLSVEDIDELLRHQARRHLRVWAH